MKIDLQEIDDAQMAGHLSMHKTEAEKTILGGGVVFVTKYGTPIGKATTIEELNQLLGCRQQQNDIEI